MFAGLVTDFSFLAEDYLRKKYIPTITNDNITIASNILPDNDLASAVEKLEKGLKCCCLGLCFFEKIFKVLGDLLPKYFEKIEELKQIYKELGGREL